MLYLVDRIPHWGDSIPSWHLSKSLGPRCLLTALLSVAVSWAAPGEAAPFTLDAPVAITGSEAGNPGVVGTLHPVALDGSLADPLGLTDGNVSFVTNDVLLVRLSLAVGSAPVDSLGIGALSNPFFGNPVGAGTYADADVSPDSVVVSGVLLAAIFDFNPTTLSAGQSSVRLFLTYSPEGSALAPGGTANFMISSGTDFTVQGTLIPEPSSVLLFATGILGLALRQRLASSRAKR